MSVLSHLVARHGQVVSRQELLEAVWDGDTSGDESLTQAISGLRRALGDSTRSPRYIQTIPKAGYRFIADINAPVTQLAQRVQRVREISMFRQGVRWQLYAAAIVVLLVAAGLFIAYDDPNPDWNINPNPDYDLEIDDIDFD